MNSNYGKPTKPTSLNNYGFDFGLGSNRSRSLNDQKNQTSSYSSSSSSFPSSYSKPNTATSSSSSSWQPRPSWTHQPAATGLPSAPTSMVGDIFGKSWGSSATPSAAAAASSIGIVNKNPNLFGDLVGSALGQNNKGNGNVPLKNATPVSASGTGSGSNKSAYSMGNMADSLPKNSSNWGSNSSNLNNMKSSNLGGPSMQSLGRNNGGGGGGMMGSNKDPFGSLVDFRSKPGASLNSVGKGTTTKSTSGNGSFGDFQNASKSSMPEFNANPSMGLNSGSYTKTDDFAIPSSQNQPPVQSSGVDAFDSLFTSSTASAGGSDGLGSQQFSGADDWGTDFGGGDDMGGTTEIEGLPPPPAGVSASTAKSKGMDNYKQGQYADAVKWLSWAVILLEKGGNVAAVKEVLSSRASCYKEVGEYKKAVADCTKILEHAGDNVAVLVQRALLYESMEKYKLGAEDLRAVMKLDPSNRVARSTIHRLTKMAD